MQTNTTSNEKKVAFITGCSSGIGYETCLKFAHNGYSVIGTVRDLSKDNYFNLKRLIETERLPIELVSLDLDKEEDIKIVIKKCLDKYGRIDVVVNNAGFGYIAAVEDIEIEKLSHQYQTNVYAPLLVMQQVLPTMRNHGSGSIINVSSILGFSSAALNAPYSSSKHALENISETLALEANKFGVKVMTVQPGRTNTKFINNATGEITKENSPYKGLYDRSTKNQSKMGGGDPAEVAGLIFDLVKKGKNGGKYTVGKDALIKKVLKSFLPSFVWVEFLKWFYKWK